MKSIGGFPAKKGGALLPLVLTGGREYPLAFYAKGLESFDEFEAMVPKPDVKKYGMFTAQGWVPDPHAPAYIDQCNEYMQLRWAYTIIKTLEPSNIEWSTVDPRKPETWKNVHEELKATLGHYERGLVIALVEEANVMDEAKLEENRNSFFQMRESLLAANNSPNSGAASTASIVPVSDSKSCPPA